MDKHLLHELVEKVLLFFWLGPSANRLNTKKTAIFRIENHAEDIKLSVLEKVAVALGKRVHAKIA